MITVEKTDYNRLIGYLKTFKFKPNFWIRPVRRKLCVFARYNGLVVGGAYVVIDNVKDNTWQVNCINGECENVYRKLIGYVLGQAASNKRSVEMFHRKDIAEIMVETGMTDTGKRMRKEFV